MKYTAMYKRHLKNKLRLMDCSYKIQYFLPSEIVIVSLYVKNEIK